MNTQTAWIPLSQRIAEKYKDSIEQHIRNLELLCMNFPEWKFYHWAKKDVTDYIELAKNRANLKWDDVDKLLSVWKSIEDAGILEYFALSEMHRQKNIQEVELNPDIIHSRVVSMNDVIFWEKDGFTPNQEALIKKVGARGKFVSFLDRIRGK